MLTNGEIHSEQVSVRTRLANETLRVMGDRVQLQLVFRNLIVNAVEAMSAITGRDRVLSIESAIAPSGVRATVTDAGEGIDAANMNRIFKRSSPPSLTEREWGFQSASRSLNPMAGSCRRCALIHTDLPSRSSCLLPGLASDTAQALLMHKGLGPPMVPARHAHVTLSAWGHLRQTRPVFGKSVILPISDRIGDITSCRPGANSRHRANLFDHLVGAREHGRRHGQFKRLGGLEVDHQFVLGRRLHRQVGRLLALEDAIDVAGRAPELIEKIRPIGDQAAAVTNYPPEYTAGSLCRAASAMISSRWRTPAR